MGIIFYFSHQPADQSENYSSSILVYVSVLADFFYPFRIEEEALHLFIRKAAHVLVYFVLGVLTYHALLRSGNPLKTAGIYALAVCFFYAVSDEVHQLFIPGRSGEVSDVLLDTTGAAGGIACIYLFNHLRDKRNKSKKERLRERKNAGETT
nr:VanZ family protein [Alkalicoccus halolimnae]